VQIHSIDFDGDNEDTLGWFEDTPVPDFEDSPFYQAARAYRRESGWDFMPGESGLWLYALAPYSWTGSDYGRASGHLAGFAILHDRDEDGTRESLAHIWTASAWRRQGIARTLLLKAREQYACHTEEGPFTEDGSALLASVSRHPG
jgi:GNAT superfamily N-acetyltransferase